MLVFVALLEHRVVVLGDSGIDRVLDPDERWESVVDAVLAGARRGALGDGIIDAVACVAAILGRHLPAPARNPDELPTALVLSER